MYSVTKRIGMIKQPYGGYLNKKQFKINSIDDGNVLNDGENIHASLMGMAVDYLTRFMIGTPLEDAFSISLMGASCLDLFLNKTISKKELALLPLSYPHHLLICSPLLILRFLIQSTN